MTKCPLARSIQTAPEIGVITTTSLQSYANRICNIWKQPWKKNAINIVIYTQTSTYGFNLRLHAVKISITLLDSLNRQGNRFLQDGHVDIVPNIWCSGETSNFLGNFHVFWKDRTKHCVCIFPLLVICKAYEKLWARTNPSNWTPSYNWAYFTWDLIECNSLGFQCSLNQCKRRA